MASSLRKDGSAGATAGLRRSVRPGTEREAISVALIVAAVEFPVCAGLLVALTASGVISTGTAMLWATLILVPLSITIGFLGFRVGTHGRREVRADRATGAGDLPQVA